MKKRSVIVLGASVGIFLYVFLSIKIYLYGTNNNKHAEMNNMMMNNNMNARPLTQPPNKDKEISTGSWYTCNITRNKKASSKNNNNDKNAAPVPTTTTAITTTVTNTTSTTITTTLILPKFPHFIIVGAQKCGTTALRDLLKQHPQIMPATKQQQKINEVSWIHKLFFWRQSSITTDDYDTMIEPHFFEQYVNYVHGKKRAQQLRDPNSSLLCELRNHYGTSFFDLPKLLLHNNNNNNNHHHQHARLVSFEKTPSYIIYPTLPQVIYRVCPWTKIIILLRNPVDRYISAYNMMTRDNAAGDHTNQTLTQLLQEEYNLLRQARLTNAPPPPPPQPPDTQNNKQQTLLFQVSNFTFLQQQRKIASVAALQTALHRGMYIPQIMDWIEYFPLYYNSTIRNHNGTLLVLKHEEFLQRPQTVLNQILDFLNLAPYYSLDYNSNKKQFPSSSSSSSSIQPKHTRDYLQNFYKPYNEELANLLGDEWRGIWDN